MIVPPELILHIAKWCDIDSRINLACALGWNVGELVGKIEPLILQRMQYFWKKRVSFAKLECFRLETSTYIHYSLYINLKVRGRVGPLRMSVSLPGPGSKMEVLNVIVRQRQSPGVWIEFTPRGMKEGQGWKWTYDRLATGAARWYLQSNQKRKQLQRSIIGL